MTLPFAPVPIRSYPRYVFSAEPTIEGVAYYVTVESRATKRSHTYDDLVAVAEQAYVEFERGLLSEIARDPGFNLTDLTRSTMKVMTEESNVNVIITLSLLSSAGVFTNHP